MFVLSFFRLSRVISHWLRVVDVKNGFFRHFLPQASRETGLASLTGDERADDKPSTRRSVAVLKQALLIRSCFLLGSYLGHALQRAALVFWRP